MAYKTFANGFPLPASDLNNFLMNQSVIVFADSAARTTAIPSPVEGMLTYLEDTNAYESWNGSAFVNINDNTDAIPKSTVTTAQDLIVADGASSVTRLGVGADDQVLSVVAGAVAWADAGGGASGNYYNITAAGTYTVDLEAGLYFHSTTGGVNVGGVALVDSGLNNYASTITSIVATSTENWTVGNAGFGTSRIFAVAYGDGVYLASSENGVLRTSTDAITWTSRSVGLGTIDIFDVAYGDGVYLAVGQSGNMATSTDAITWTTRTSGFGSDWIYAVTYGDGVYVAVGAGTKITTSTDAITWTSRTSNFASSEIYAVTYGDGVYIAAGRDGDLVTSTDATTWTSRTSGTTDRIRTVAYGNSLYLLAGDSGVMRSSTDGTTWTSQTSGFGTSSIQGINYADGLFVAVAGGGQIRTSPDGITWTNRDSGTTQQLYGVTFGNGVHVAAGNLGVVTTSQFNALLLSLELKSPITNLPA